jgi:hypothetical protein
MRIPSPSAFRDQIRRVKIDGKVRRDARKARPQEKILKVKRNSTYLCG